MVSPKSHVVSMSKKIIKPSSPTPSSLRRHNLSFLDQLASPAHNPLAFFYPKLEKSWYDLNHISTILENSLANVLTSYYPFAGTVKENMFVDCNDVGAEFFNVRVDFPMSEILNHPYNDATNFVYPQGCPWNTSYEGTLVVTQLTHFDCGGIAVGVCISHKVADAYSVIKFITDWASLTRDSGLAKPSTLFDGTSFFPPTNDLSILPNFEPEKDENCVTRLYHFSSSGLDRLKIIAAAESGVENPTRVEVATALVHKHAMAASAKTNNSGSFKPSLLCHIMGLRPPLPLSNIGNACSFFLSMTSKDDEMKFPNLVAELRKAKHQLRDKLKNVPQNEVFFQVLEIIKGGAELLEQVSKSDVYKCSSLCHFGLYNTDFGWEKPTRVTSASPGVKNQMFFMDSPSGNGLDVVVTLEEKDMEIFQSDKGLLEFASPIVKM
ncbi:acylsugar acyltransferase 3-like [Solanum dulcamara]|uniref:acylsugar acyltransferase 3-like n=1 Tax=Solanum dulcamara TaxID=45834 RepID=UPI002485B11F|nr:acylsugar acyltransferase 3-like [Solanum dulcamara]